MLYSIQYHHLMIHLYNTRVEALQVMLVDKKIDAFFVTNSFNITYLTGFIALAPHEREAFVLVTRRNVYVFSDGRYQEDIQCLISNNQLASNKPIFKLLTSQKGLLKHLQEIIDGEKIKKLGFEREDLKWSEHEAINNNVITTTRRRAPPTARVIRTRAAHFAERASNRADWPRYV